MNVNISQVTVTLSNGKKQKFNEYKGKVLLIVNVASQCGFTKQYEGLQALQTQYKSQGFEILAFPCNDFGSQEPGSLEEIKAFCSKTYGVEFQIFEKVHAKGSTTEPYSTLNQSNPAGDVKWNFEKFLISKKGDVLKRFESSIEPNNSILINAIEKALEA